MSYEEYLTNYIQQVENVHLSAKSAPTTGLNDERTALIRDIELQTAKAKDTLGSNRALLIGAYNTADAAGKAKLEADLKEMILGIEQVERALIKAIGR